MPPALQWLTPAETRRVPLPRWVVVPLALGLAAHVGERFGVVGNLPGLAFDLVAGVALADWFEERIYGLLGHANRAVKVTVPGLLVLFAVPALAFFQVSRLLPLGIGSWVGATSVVFWWWVGGAAAGTVMVTVLDVLVSAWQARFRTRLTLAIGGLIAIALVQSLIVGLAAAQVTAAISTSTAGLKVDLFGLKDEVVWGFLRANPIAVPAGLFGLVILFTLPAFVSASSKLADAAMERVRPLSRGFAAVSAGERGVRVEERGSVEFIELAQNFNRMVTTLATSEQMERAFGRYVSGQVLAKIRAQHGEAALPAEQREATVFFADIRGFTTFSEKLRPDQVVTVLNTYLARVVARIDEHLGYLNKFIGDAVVVVFNGPVDQPDHAERAVRCALALQDEVKALNAEGVLKEIGELRIGVGVATGPMVCGNVGGPTQMEYTVIGDTVNLSARLTSLAGPGEVWVNEATAKGAGALKFTPLPEVKVKGKEKPVTPFKAEGLR